MFKHEIYVLQTETACRVVVYEVDTDGAKQVRDIFERTVTDIKSIRSFAKWIDSCIGDEIANVTFIDHTDFGRARTFSGKLIAVIKDVTSIK